MVSIWSYLGAERKPKQYGMTQPMEALDDFGQYLKERQAIGIVFHDGLAPIAAGGDVAKGA